MLKLINKKGISVIIGYVLLITFAVVMGVIVFAWMSSYILNDEEKCSDDVSLIVSSYTYTCETGKLSLEFQNKGLFNISAFKIRGSNNETRERATIRFEGTAGTDYFVFQKPLFPNGEKQKVVINYDKIKYPDKDLKFVEITPYIFEDGESRICTNAIIKQELGCFVEEVIPELPIIPDTCVDSDGGYNFNVFGTVYYNGITYPDSCNGDYLSEQVCNVDGVADFFTYYCPFSPGMVCENNICVTPQSLPEVCNDGLDNDGDDLADCADFVDCGIYTECATGYCSSLKTCDTCVETDGGYDLNNFGEVYYNGNTFSDSCSYGTYILEYMCSGGSSSSILADCSMSGMICNPDEDRCVLP